MQFAPRRSTDFLLLRRRRQKAPKRAIERVIRLNVNPIPSAAAFTFDSGAIVFVPVGELAGSADALSARRTLYNRSRM